MRLLVIAGIAFCSGALPLQSAGPDRPNGVIILANDPGWHGAMKIRTPNIDWLAADGHTLHSSL